MKIISHRGLWRNLSERNTEHAFRESIALGFGIETDVRDCAGELVISHDMPTGSEMRLATLLSLAMAEAQSPITIAINIKADGLAADLQRLLKNYPTIDTFVFDMSIPDTRAYLDTDIKVFSRTSEIERTPAWFDRVEGIWLDAFESDWYGEKILSKFIEQGKYVCVVSPELHGRQWLQVWEMLHPFSMNKKLMMCTDFPLEARDYFFSSSSDEAGQ